MKMSRGSKVGLWGALTLVVVGLSAAHVDAGLVGGSGGATTRLTSSTRVTRQATVKSKSTGEVAPERDTGVVDPQEVLKLNEQDGFASGATAPQ
jgi:hypothetical protein